MKRVVFYILVTVMMLVSCVPNKANDTVNDRHGFHISGMGRVEVVVIDSCEYLICHNKMTHKGNCKFCRESSKKE